jgi:hypothetical protein
MGKSLTKEIEEYVSDWHWDENSAKYAFEMGTFLYSFMDYVESKNLSARTKKSHRENVYLIGMFETSYSDGYDEFYPENLEDGPNYTDEFERKISDSSHAVRSYESSWRKLDAYIKSGAYKAYLSKVEEKLASEKS